MQKKIVLTGGLMGVVAILLGAFGAHGLKALLTQDALNTFEVGVRYQMYHALFLLFLALTSIITVKQKQLIFYMVLTGVLLFSGSIYLLAVNSLFDFNFKILGPVTPIGGIFLIVAWGLLIKSVLKHKFDNENKLKA